MTNSLLDSRQEIEKLDKSNLIKSVEALPDQILETIKQTRDIKVPASYRDAKNIVVSGMGGSVLGSHIIHNLYKKELSVPFEVVSHYELPGYVNSDSLVLLSSYSGTTEETLAAGEDAKSRGAKVMVITGGGPLLQMAVDNNWPYYHIEPSFNPCGQPRLAIGYAVAGQMALLTCAGFLPDETKLLEKTAEGLRPMIARLNPDATHGNTAKLLAYQCYEKHIILSGAEHLIGAAHVFNNQINENSKALTSEWHLPEFNHHYMEALSFPRSTHENTIFLLFNSQSYHERVQKRFPITKELLEQKGYEVHLIQATAPTKLEQVFEIIQLGEFVAAYLPLLYGIEDPGPVPNVSWFKDQMAN